jgi:hypothetical protein
LRISVSVGNFLVLSLENINILLIVTSKAPDLGGEVLLFIMTVDANFSIEFATRTKSG